MPMDAGTIIAALTFIAAIIASGIAVILRWGKIEATAEVAREAKADVELLRTELSNFKERAARDYATAEMVAQVQRTVGEGFAQLGNRIDSILMHWQRNSDGN